MEWQLKLQILIDCEYCYDLLHPVAIFLHLHCPVVFAERSFLF